MSEKQPIEMQPWERPCSEDEMLGYVVRKLAWAAAERSGRAYGPAVVFPVRRKVGLSHMALDLREVAMSHGNADELVLAKVALLDAATEREESDE